MGTTVYIDGFNLYYGCLKRTPYRWLDLEAFCRRLLPRDTIERIRYFTARVSARPGDPSQPIRQQTYLRAVATLPLVEVHYGHYLQSRVRMPLVHPPGVGSRTAEVVKDEEKGSDVNLATYLLLDAFKAYQAGKQHVAVVVSNDSDLKLPVEVVQMEFGFPVGIINPHPARYRSRALQGTFFKQVQERALKSSQLAARLRDAQGPIVKPANW